MSDRAIQRDLGRTGSGTGRIRWGAAVGGALAAEATLIAAAVAWVAIYSYLVHPGESAAFYGDYAAVASPWVSIFAGAPVFFCAARWIARNWPTAMGLFAIYLLLDIVGLTLAADGRGLVVWIVGLSYASKFLACHLGGRALARSEDRRTA